MYIFVYFYIKLCMEFFHKILQQEAKSVGLASSLCFCFAGLCLLLSFCIWLGRFMDAGARIDMFGAGLWIDLVAGLFCIVTAVLTHVMIKE